MTKAISLYRKHVVPEEAHPLLVLPYRHEYFAEGRTRDALQEKIGEHQKQQHEVVIGEWVIEGKLDAA